MQQIGNTRHSVFAPISDQCIAKMRSFAQNVFWQQWLEVIQSVHPSHRPVGNFRKGASKFINIEILDENCIALFIKRTTILPHHPKYYTRCDQTV